MSWYAKIRMTKEFNLSEKIGVTIPTKNGGFVKALQAYKAEDVKEFIRRLKEEIKRIFKDSNADACNIVLNKLAGDKLS